MIFDLVFSILIMFWIFLSLLISIEKEDRSSIGSNKKRKLTKLGKFLYLPVLLIGKAVDSIDWFLERKCFQNQKKEVDSYREN